MTTNYPMIYRHINKYSCTWNPGPPVRSGPRGVVDRWPGLGSKWSPVRNPNFRTYEITLSHLILNLYSRVRTARRDVDWNLNILTHLTLESTLNHIRYTTKANHVHVPVSLTVHRIRSWSKTTSSELPLLHSFRFLLHLAHTKILCWVNADIKMSRKDSTSGANFQDQDVKFISVAICKLPPAKSKLG